MERENGNGNVNWRQLIKRFNLVYLRFVRLIGADRVEHRDYAKTALDLDTDIIELLMNSEEEVLHKIADVGYPVFKLKIKDVKSAVELYAKGNEDRLDSLLATTLAADRGGMEVEP